MDQLVIFTTGKPDPDLGYRFKEIEKYQSEEYTIKSIQFVKQEDNGDPTILVLLEKTLHTQ